MSDALAEDEVARGIFEIVMGASPGGIDEDEINKGYAALSEMAVSAVIFEAWQEGRFQVGWNVEKQELSFKPKDEASK